MVVKIARLAALQAAAAAGTTVELAATDPVVSLDDKLRYGQLSPLLSHAKKRTSRERARSSHTMSIAITTWNDLDNRTEFIAASNKIVFCPQQQ